MNGLVLDLFQVLLYKDRKIQLFYIHFSEDVTKGSWISQYVSYKPAIACYTY